MDTVLPSFLPFYLYLVLRIKPSASHMVGEHSITEPQPQSRDQVIYDEQKVIGPQF